MTKNRRKMSTEKRQITTERQNDPKTTQTDHMETIQGVHLYHWLLSQTDFRSCCISFMGQFILQQIRLCKRACASSVPLSVCGPSKLSSVESEFTKHFKNLSLLQTIMSPVSSNVSCTVFQCIWTCSSRWTCSGEPAGRPLQSVDGVWWCDVECSY